MKACLQAIKTGGFLSWLIIGLMFFIPVSPTIKSIYLALILLSLLALPSFRQEVMRAIKTPLAYLSLAFFSWILLSCFWSPADFSLKLIMLDKYSKLLFFPLLMAASVQARTRQWGIWAFLAAMFLTGLLALLQKFAVLNLHGTGAADPGFVFQSHIMTGFMFAYAAYCCIWAFVSSKRPLSRGVYGFLTLFFSYEVFFVNVGRTGYFVYFALSLLFCLQYFSFKRALLAIFLSMTAFTLVYSVLDTSMRKNINVLFSSYHNYFKNKKDSSLGYRMQFHDYAANLTKEKPIFGHGAGSFAYYFEKEKPVKSWQERLLEPHSEYWLVMVQQGMLGLFLLLVYFAGFLWYAKNLATYKPQCTALIIAFMIGCISDSLLFYGSTGYFFICFAALYFGEWLEEYRPLDSKAMFFVQRR